MVIVWKSVSHKLVRPVNDFNGTLYGHPMLKFKVHTTWFCPRIKLSSGHILCLYGVETGVLLSDFSLLHRKAADVTHLYFSSIDAS